MGEALFDRSRLLVKPLAQRTSDLDISVVRPLEADSGWSHPALGAVAQDIRAARVAGASVLFMLGGHVVRSGVQRHLIDLMERGLVTGLAVNGAVMIHDFELSLCGETTESVARYIATGEFGLWSETGRLNDIINQGHAQGLGMGLAVGRAVLDGGFPHKGTSLLAQGARLGVPVTVHVGVGFDIIHEHPNCDGAAVGATSYRDFLTFAQGVSGLEGGVVCNFGSAVMAPEVFLKALAMARNVAAQEGRGITRFTSLVCDLRPLPEDCSREPDKNDPAYYFRPWKTMLSRGPAGGGRSHYVCARHERTVPALWAELTQNS